MDFRETVPARAAFKFQEYWRRPLAGFGDPEAWLMVLGLAPAAHGGNRTGRVFTGDSSAKFLMHTLHRTGFANQPDSLSKDDGLRLSGCYITAAVRCVPPDNRPTPQEFRNCAQFFEREIELLTNIRAVVALGHLAFKAYLDFGRRKGQPSKAIAFAHGVRVEMENLPWLYGSYHPSPRNTYTGRLTEDMLVDVLERARKDTANR